MKFKKLNGILSFVFFLSLFWTADRLDPGDNGSHSNDSQNAQPETLLNYLFQTFIVLPTSTSDVERGFSKMNAIKTALRNRLGSVLIHLL